MAINREKYYKWAWLIDLFVSKESNIGGLSTNREKLYDTAYSFLGRDASPRDLADDEFGCAESVNAVYKAAFGKEIGGDLSTLRMYQALLNSPDFVQIDSPLFGDVIISPTTYARVPVGHVGIVGKWQVMSNDSRSGKWEANYTLQSWRLRYGFVKYFRCVEIASSPTQENLPEAPPGVKEIVAETIEVATEAVKYPMLLAPVMALLAALGNFLKSLNIK